MVYTSCSMGFLEIVNRGLALLKYLFRKAK